MDDDLVFTREYKVKIKILNFSKFVNRVKSCLKVKFRDQSAQLALLPLKLYIYYITSKYVHFYSTNFSFVM